MVGLKWLHVESDVVLVVLLSVDFSLDMLVTLFVKHHSSELDWWRSLLESRREVYVLGNNAFVEQRDHPLVDVLFVNWGRVRHVFLVLDVPLHLGVSLLTSFNYAG